MFSDLKAIISLYLSLMVQYLKAIVFDSCGRSPL
jgi:hypothetical protein